MDVEHQARRDEVQRVAAYGTLKHGHCNHGYLRGCKIVGVQRISGFKMYPIVENFQGEPSGFPVCVPNEPNDNYDVHVEIYEINDDDLAGLDRLEGYPDFYNRKLIATNSGDAWLYYLDSPPRTKRILTGEW